MFTYTFCAPIIQETFDGLISAVLSSEGPIRINFATDGGDINIGIRMYSWLRELDRPITMLNLSNIDSAGVLPFLAADTRLVTPHSSFLVHRITRGINGQFVLADLQEHSDALRFDIQRYADLYIQRTVGAESPLDIRSILEGAPAVQLSAKQALSAGLATAMTADSSES